MRAIEFGLTALVASSLACASAGGGELFAFSESAAAREATPSSNWSLPPERAEQILRSMPFEIRSVQGAGGGVTGAQKADVVFEIAEAEEDEVYLWEMSGDVDLKVKPFPSPSLDGWNNNPRKEIATYELQKLFLEPRDYVVPTTLARCVSIEAQLRFRPDAHPTLDGSDCELVAISLWLENVTVPEPFYVEARFRSDASYAYAYGTFNILTYLANHRDNRKGNFLASKDERSPHVYAIDNGIAFGSRIYNWFAPSSYAWRKIVVPALPKSAVDRLRELQREDLEPLGVLVEFHRNSDRQLEIAAPTANLDPSRPVRITERIVQLGLTKGEIDDLWSRIETLIERVDEGDLVVF